MAEPSTPSKIANEIEKIAKENPHLRVGQILINALKDSPDWVMGAGVGDVFYVPDAVLLEALRNHTRNQS